VDADLTSDLPLWADQEAYALLKEICASHSVPMEVFQELVGIERRHQHRERARGIYDEFDNAFSRMD
jgi:hypothetical protein